LWIRSHAFDKNKHTKRNHKSSIDSHVSMRSQTNPDNKQSSPNGLENASTLRTEASMRWLAQPNNKIDAQNLGDNKTTSMVSVRTIANN
jgi:response regulator of citrate/malate metabolism